jgi:hypothetical protein
MPKEHRLRQSAMKGIKQTPTLDQPVRHGQTELHWNRYATRRGLMSREKFLTLRWNNILSLGLGLIVLMVVIGALATGVWSDRDGFIGIAVLGALY